MHRISWAAGAYHPGHHAGADPVGIEAQPVVPQLLLHVPRRGSQPAREATLALRFCPLTLYLPQHRQTAGFPAITLWTVQVAEVEPPTEVEPIAWLLVTTMTVETVDDAIERVQ